MEPYLPILTVGLIAGLITHWCTGTKSIGLMLHLLAGIIGAFVGKFAYEQAGVSSSTILNFFHESAQYSISTYADEPLVITLPLAFLGALCFIYALQRIVSSD